MLSTEVIDAVVFDMGGVFVVPNPVTISALLQTAGITQVFEAADASVAHYAGIRAITELLAAQTVDESDHDVWWHYDTAAFRAAGFSGDTLAAAVEVRGAIRREREVEGIWTHRLAANIDAFARIAEIRPVAIVTNNNGTAIQQCLDHGICQVDPGGPLPHVPAIVDSAILEIAKPDPRIFTPALDALGTDAARTLYVGDTVHADVLGATRAGMPVVQLDPDDLHADHDHWRLPDVVALAEVFGA